MASTKTLKIRGLLALFVLVILAAACSSSAPTEPAATPSETATAESDSQAPQDEAVETTADPTPTPVPEPTLADQDLASVVALEAGEQVQDAQGNLIAIYGVVEWPQTFAALSDPSQEAFPFFGDVQAVVDPASKLIVLDVGMCAAGLDAVGFGTAEFFVHESSSEVLSTDAVLNRGILTRHPVVRPGFDFPSPAECERGYLPVLWRGDSPAVARYVLATRSSASAAVEQHVYQWALDRPEAAIADTTSTEAADPDDVQFSVGQTVTFNQGRLQDTTLEVGGWSELVGRESPIEGTRLVAVAVDVCPASGRLPEFGLGVDSWNIIAPVAAADLGIDLAEDPTATCGSDNWIEFAVPFGSVPTAFFASDGVRADVGYAEWSLVGGAVAAPQP